MKKRPIVWVTVLYLLFLVTVLILCPQWGEDIFGWNRKEQRLKERYQSGQPVEGQIASVRKTANGYQARMETKDGDICIVLLEDTAFEVGDRVLVSGKIRWPEPGTNPGQWDGGLYARIHRFSFYVRAENTQILDTQETNAIVSRLLGIKNLLLSKIDEQWTQPWSGLLRSIMLGDKSELSEESSELLSQAGLSHIMAISGLHLTVLAEGLVSILKKKQKPKPAQAEAAVLLWIYVYLTGSSVATVRAALMMTIKTAAFLLDREEDPPTTLAMTAGILLVYQPLYLLDAGFCLSFAALLGLWYGKIWCMMLPVIPYRVRQWGAASIGVSMTTIPVSLRFFYQSSLWGFLLNFWVLPAMGVLLPAAIIALGLSFVHPALGKGLALVVQLLLWSFQKGSEWIVKIPGGMLRGQPALYQLALYYGVLVIAVLYYAKPLSQIRKISLGIASLAASFLMFYHASTWRIMYLDVGQGDCAVVEWRDSVWIIDAGPEYEDVLRPYLMQRGIREIEGLILSHPDWDHLEGMLALSKDADFVVKGLWEADQACQETEKRQRLERNIQNQGGTVRKVRNGYALLRDDFSMQVLSPVQEYENPNDGSLVVALSVQGNRFLFTGDISEQTEADLQDVWKEVDVLKVAHHGSKSSSSSDFLQKTRPGLAVISCDREGSYGHPDEEVLSRLEEAEACWLVTDDVGAIWIESAGEKVFYRYFQSE